MTLTVSNNSAVAFASHYLGKNQKALQMSIKKLASGKKIVAPGDDPGTLSVSMKLNAAVTRLTGARNNVQNGISFMEVQDGMLETAGRIINRMAEMKGMATADPMKSDQDVDSYNNEFHDLQQQLFQISQQTFNGSSIFANTLDKSDGPQGDGNVEADLVVFKSDTQSHALSIFTSDNGLLEGEHGMVDKRTGHEPSLRIPLVVRYPDLVSPKYPKKIEAQTLTLDFASSILEICGAPPLKKTQGKSWKKLITTGDPEWRTSWYYEYNYEKQFPYTPNVRALRTDEWKYIRYPHGDGSPDKHMAELYNLKSDPGETRNLIKDARYEALVAKLRKELDQRIQEANPGKKDEMPMDEGIKGELPDEKIR